MRFPRFLLLNVLMALAFFVSPSVRAVAAGPGDIADMLVPHKALYDIDLVSTRSGSQVINISGKMYYEWRPSCDAWTTDHRFSLVYEYADSPGMRVLSDFSTYEPFDGKSLDFASRRQRDGELYQELRGHAEIEPGKAGEAVYSLPEGLSFDLSPDTLFPMAHTIEMVRQAQQGEKFFSAQVFDGSDDEGPIEINTFIGEKVNAMKMIQPSKDVDMTLLNSPAWKVRMAVFPLANDDQTSSDYEMSMIFHDNGVISDMLIEYDDFSVTQKLVALERLPEDKSCAHKADKVRSRVR